jgi:hypothetical protein
MARIVPFLLLASSVHAAYIDYYPASMQSGSTGFKIWGNAGNCMGDRATTAGDFNGDGISDIIFTAIPLSKDYVVFGKSGSAPFSTFFANALVSGDTTGFTISVPSGWRSAAGIGDFNGDGIEDIVFSDAAIDYAGRSDCGAVYVHYGRRTGITDFDVNGWSTSTSNGFRIYGERTNDYFGHQMFNVGDYMETE